MWKLSCRAPSPRPDRRGRGARPLVEGLEAREVLTSLLAPTSLVLLNPQPLPPGSSPITYWPSGPITYSPSGLF